MRWLPGLGGFPSENPSINHQTSVCNHQSEIILLPQGESERDMERWKNKQDAETFRAVPR